MRALHFLLALSLWGCASHPSIPGHTGLTGFDGFPSIYGTDELRATAKFKLDHREEFYTDLIEERGVIPIRLSVGLTEGIPRNDNTLITADHLDIQLHLPDGTTLLPEGNLSGLMNSLDSNPQKRVRLRVFRGEVLEPFNEDRGSANTGYFFFQLPADEVMSVVGLTVSHTAGDAIRTFDLNQALVSFNVTVDGKRHAVMVGVQ
ncbi:MAG: hypothetical protein ACI9EF_000998 [Pseudohongiellaceae bacterium]|jgi:hypothetical protein